MDNSSGHTDQPASVPTTAPAPSSVASSTHAPVPFWKRLSSKSKLISLGVLLLIITGIPATVLLSQQQQDTRQHASGGVSSVTCDPRSRWSLSAFSPTGVEFKHSMNITQYDPTTGKFSGDGFYSGNTGSPVYKWSISGQMGGQNDAGLDTFTATIVELETTTPYSSNLTGYVSGVNGPLVGTFSDSNGGKGTFTTTSGQATCPASGTSPTTQPTTPALPSPQPTGGTTGGTGSLSCDPNPCTPDTFKADVWVCTNPETKINWTYPDGGYMDIDVNGQPYHHHIDATSVDTAKNSIANGEPVDWITSAGDTFTWTAYNKDGTVSKADKTSCKANIGSTPPLPSAKPTGPADSGIGLSLDVLMDGVGNAGDSTNPTNHNSSTTPTTKPALTKTSIPIRVLIESPENEQNVLAIQYALLQYDPASGSYKGTVPITCYTTGGDPVSTAPQVCNKAITSGNYIIKIKDATHLQRRVPNTVAISANIIPISQVTLVAGDVNNDNVLDLQDYSQMLSAFACSGPTAPDGVDCKAVNVDASDINWDGTVDPKDLNLFLREIQVQQGDQ